MKNFLGLFFGIFFASIGVTVLKSAHIATGGTAGLSLSGSYLFDASFSQIFFLINIPFYIFSYFQMGLKFTLYTMVSVSLLSLFTNFMSILPHVSFENFPLLGAILGGLFVGYGLSILFKNDSSLGGFNILSLFIFKKFNINPGKTTFVFDFLVLTTGFYAIGFIDGLYSVFSVAIIGYVISLNKKSSSTATATAGSSSTSASRKSTATSTA